MPIAVPAVDLLPVNKVIGDRDLVRSVEFAAREQGALSRFPLRNPPVQLDMLQPSMCVSGVDHEGPLFRQGRGTGSETTISDSLYAISGNRS